MSKVINITDKLDNNVNSFQIGEEVFPVDNSLTTVMKFNELAQDLSVESFTSAIEISLGKKAVKSINPSKVKVQNFKVILTGIFAAMMDLDYEEAEARFQGQ